MTKNGKSEFASPFDDMLAENREALDNLYGGPAPRPEVAVASARPAATSPRSTASRPSAPPPRPAAPAGAAIKGSADGIAFSFRP